MSRRYDVVLFDLDGTLIDSIELIFASYRHTLRVHLDLAVPEDVLRQGLGTPLGAQLAQFTPDAERIEAMIATYRAHNAELHDQAVRPYDGARDAVEALHRAGLRLGIVTSKRRAAVRRGLEVCGFDLGRFATLVCAGETTRHKPHPAPVLRALAALDARPERTLFVGDSPHDLVAGRRAEVSTGACEWGPFSRAELEGAAPDHWLHAPAALPPLVLGGPAAAGRGQSTFE